MLTEAYVSLDCFMNTTAMLHNYHQLITTPFTHRTPLCSAWALNLQSVHHSRHGKCYCKWHSPTPGVYFPRSLTALFHTWFSQFWPFTSEQALNFQKIFVKHDNFALKYWKFLFQYSISVLAMNMVNINAIFQCPPVQDNHTFKHGDLKRCNCLIIIFRL
jgi:hypothetical protein